MMNHTPDADWQEFVERGKFFIFNFRVH